MKTWESPSCEEIKPTPTPSNPFFPHQDDNKPSFDGRCDRDES